MLTSLVFLLLVFPNSPNQGEGLIVLVAVREAWAQPQALTVEVAETKSVRKKKKVSRGWEYDVQAVQLLIQVPKKSLSD